jgi:hypothetical protein
MKFFTPASIAALKKQFKDMAAARQATKTLKLADQTFVGWATLKARFENGLEFVLIVDTEWGFLKKFPKGLSKAERLQRSSSKAAFELSLRLCKKEADGTLTEIASYNPVIQWSDENQRRCPYKIGGRHCSRELYDKKVTKTLIAGSRELVTEKEAYKGLQVHLELWEGRYALTTTNCITCGSNVQGADINMVEHVSAIDYNLARVTKFSEFSMVIDTRDYFKFLHPKGTSAAQDMVLIIHQAPLNTALSPGARHRGDTDTENLRLLLSCPHKLEVPPDRPRRPPPLCCRR